MEYDYIYFHVPVRTHFIYPVYASIRAMYNFETFILHIPPLFQAYLHFWACAVLFLFVTPWRLLFTFFFIHLSSFTAWRGQMFSALGRLFVGQSSRDAVYNISYWLCFKCFKTIWRNCWMKLYNSEESFSTRHQTGEVTREAQNLTQSLVHSHLTSFICTAFQFQTNIVWNEKPASESLKLKHEAKPCYPLSVSPLFPIRYLWQSKRAFASVCNIYGNYTRNDWNCSTLLEIKYKGNA